MQNHRHLHVFEMDDYHQSYLQTHKLYLLQDKEQGH